MQINERLDKEPALVNNDPYGDGWMITLRMSRADDLKGLMSPSEYRTAATR